MLQAEPFNLFDYIFSLDHLVAAAHKCYANVKWKSQPQKFMNHIMLNCMSLRKDVYSGQYSMSPTTRFYVHERGKTRNILPVAFRDRVVQRAICDNFLLDATINYVIDDCSACLKGRGISYANNRVQMYAEQAEIDSWIVQFDFHDYFHSISIENMMGRIREILKDERLLDIILTILSVGEEGIELGSHISQLCAALYPTPMDKAIIAAPGVTGYHRYMDDGIIFCKTKEDAQRTMSLLLEWIDKLGLQPNPKKTFYNRITQPFVFCKIRYTKDKETGHVRKNVRKPQTRHCEQHIKRVLKLAETNPSINTEPLKASFKGYLMRGDANLDRLIEQTFGEK